MNKQKIAWTKRNGKRTAKEHNGTQSKQEQKQQGTKRDTQTKETTMNKQGTTWNKKQTRKDTYEHTWTKKTNKKQQETINKRNGT